MYVDLIILIILFGLVIFFFRNFSSFVYSAAIIDIALRILTFIKYNSVPELNSLIGKYLPESIPAIIGQYVKGALYDVIIWCYVIIFIIFWVYIVRYFIKKRK